MYDDAIWLSYRTSLVRIVTAKNLCKNLLLLFWDNYKVFFEI